MEASSAEIRLANYMVERGILLERLGDLREPEHRQAKRRVRLQQLEEKLIPTAQTAVNQQ